jgi:hypothetical protein
LAPGCGSEMRASPGISGGGELMGTMEGEAGWGAPLVLRPTEQALPHDRYVARGRDRLIAGDETRPGGEGLRYYQPIVNVAELGE